MAKPKTRLKIDYQCRCGLGTTGTFDSLKDYESSETARFVIGHVEVCPMADSDQVREKE